MNQEAAAAAKSLLPKSPISPSASAGSTSPIETKEIVNHKSVEKVAPPEIARNVKNIFESGQFTDLHEVKKLVVDCPKPGADETTCVVENEPVRLEGVCRETDRNMEGEQVKRGATKKLTTQWKTQKNTFQANKGPIKLAEDEGKVIENDPAQRDDVIRETDESDEILPSRGYTKKFAQKFQMPKEESKVKKRAIKLVDDPTAQTIVLENEPEQQKEGIARSDEKVEDDLQIEDGRTTKLAGMWQNRKDDSAPIKRQPIVIERDGGPTILESEPAQTDPNIVKGGTQDDYMVGNEAGRIRNIAGSFGADQVENGDDRPRKEKIYIERETGAVVLENEPEQTAEGIVRGDVITRQEEFHILKRGAAKKLVNRWKQNEEDASQTQSSTDKVKGKPAWMVEIEQAREAGVYENEPDNQRDDIAREEDIYEQPELIPESVRNMRAMWATRDAENTEPGEKTPQVIMRPRKKKVIPEPEPEPEPEEKPRRGRAVRGRGRKAKEPEPEPQPEPQKPGRKGKKPPPPAEPEPPPPQKGAPFGAFKLKSVKKPPRK